MYNHKTRSILLAAVLICTISACRKKSDDPAPGGSAKEGMIKMEFFNKVGPSPLRMDGTWYKNEHGDSFTVSTFNYYISNIRFNRARWQQLYRTG